MAGSGQKIFLSPYKTFLVCLLGFAQGVFYLLPYLSGQYYSTMIKMLNCTNEQLGSLMSIMGIVMFIAMIPGGWVADKFETRKLVSLSLILVGLGGLSLAYIPDFEYYYAMWGFFSIVGNLLYWSAAIKFIRIVTTEEEQGRAYGYFYALNGLATTIFAALGAFILTQSGEETVQGLKTVIIVYSLMNIICGVSVFFAFRGVKSAKGVALQDEEKPSFKEMLSVLTTKETWVFAFICFGLYCLNSIMLSYFSAFFVDVVGISEAMASNIYAFITFISMFIPIAVGVFADRLGSIIKMIIYSITVVIAVLGIMLYLNQNIPLWGAVLIEVIAYSFAGGAYSIQFSAFDEIKLDRKIAGSCVAMASIIGYSADIFMWTLFGSFIDKHGNDGYLYIFGTLLGLSILALFAAYTLSVWSKQKKTEA